MRPDLGTQTFFGPHPPPPRPVGRTLNKTLLPVCEPDRSRTRSTAGPASIAIMCVFWLLESIVCRITIRSLCSCTCICLLLSEPWWNHPARRERALSTPPPPQLKARLPQPLRQTLFRVLQAIRSAAGPLVTPSKTPYFSSSFRWALPPLGASAKPPPLPQCPRGQHRRLARLSFSQCTPVPAQSSRAHSPLDTPTSPPGGALPCPPTASAQRRRWGWSASRGGAHCQHSKRLIKVGPEAPFRSAVAGSAPPPPPEPRVHECRAPKSFGPF